MAEIRDLIRALGEPSSAEGVVESSQWPAVEQHFGLVVPPKVRGFYETFGASVICANYTILSPTNPSVAASSVVEQVEYARAAQGRGATLKIWPLAGGLLPYGAADDGDYLFWDPAIVSNGDWVAWRGDVDGAWMNELGTFTDSIVNLVESERHRSPVWMPYPY